MNDLLNFGFDPTGTALGSEGSPSMPGDQLTGLENPMVATGDMLAAFTEQTQRRYGDVSDVGGSIWDPRGQNALSSKTSDYKTSDLMRPDEIGVQLNPSDDQLQGGDPVLAPYNPDTSAFAQALYDQDMGLSAQGAATLADSLVSYDPKILEGVYLPKPVEPQVTNEIGLTSQSGGLPDAFFDASAGVVKQGVPETVDRVISQGTQYQYVDSNGVVDKYTPGTSPYDTIAEGRMAGLAQSYRRQTPASVRATGRVLSLMDGRAARNTSVRNTTSSSVASPSVSSSASLASSGDPVEVESETAVTGASIGQTAATSGSGATYSALEASATDAAASAATASTKRSSWWWLLLAVPVVGGGVYLATRKGKRGRRR